MVLGSRCEDTESLETDRQHQEAPAAGNASRRTSAMQCLVQPCLLQQRWHCAASAARMVKLRNIGLPQGVLVPLEDMLGDKLQQHI